MFEKGLIVVAHRMRIEIQTQNGVVELVVAPGLLCAAGAVLAFDRAR